MRKLIFIIIFLFSFNLFVSGYVEAANVLPRFRGVGKAVRKGMVSGVTVSPRLRGDRRALSIFFSNLKKARSITYTLIYQTSGKDEGVSGSIDSSTGDTATRELLFGTCSAGVCRYHSNISSMRLEVITELTSGKRTVKRFRIKV